MIDKVLGRHSNSKHIYNSCQHNDLTESNSDDDGGDDDNDNDDLDLISASPHKKHTNSNNNSNNKYIKSPTTPAHTTHTIHTTPAVRVKHKPKGTNPLASKVSSKVSR